MSCCYTCLLDRSSISWSDFSAQNRMSVPVGLDLDLHAAAGGTVVVVVYSAAVNSFDSAAAQLVGKAIVRGCDVDDTQDFIGPELFRVELGQAVGGEAITITLPDELDATARLFLDVIQGVVGSASESIELSVWLRTPEGAHA